MPWPLEAKIESELRLRELLRSHGMPQPDKVEYGYSCVRFLFNESKTCVVIDLDGWEPGSHSGPGTDAE
jgi:hypothetical protein